MYYFGIQVLLIILLIGINNFIFISINEKRRVHAGAAVEVREKYKVE